VGAGTGVAVGATVAGAAVAAGSAAAVGFSVKVGTTVAVGGGAVVGAGVAAPQAVRVRAIRLNRQRVRETRAAIMAITSHHNDNPTG